MSKKRDTKVFSVRMREELLEKIRVLAEKEHRYMNQQVEYILEQYFDNIEEGVENMSKKDDNSDSENEHERTSKQDRGVV